jgi:hypothetical protein
VKWRFSAPGGDVEGSKFSMAFTWLLIVRFHSYQPKAREEGEGAALR